MKSILLCTKEVILSGAHGCREFVISECARSYLRMAEFKSKIAIYHINMAYGRYDEHVL